MDFKVLATTFAMVFLAELGDKTQLATFSFAAQGKFPLSVFLGSAGALIATSAVAVLLGASIGRLVPVQYIRIGTAILFVLLGVWMLFSPGTE